MDMKKDKNTYTDILRIGDKVGIYGHTTIAEYDPEIHAFYMRSRVDSRIPSITHFYYPADCPPFKLTPPKKTYEYPSLERKNINGVIYTATTGKNFPETGEITWVSNIKIKGNKKSYKTIAKAIYSQQYDSFIGTGINPGVIKGEIDRIILKTGEAGSPQYREEIAIVYMANYAKTYTGEGLSFVCVNIAGGSGMFWVSPTILKIL